MNTTGYHTVEDRDDPDHVADNAPFQSMGALAFLGAGYYFWEENESLAHWWGGSHCRGDYIICKGKIQCSEELYFDLLGKIPHIMHLKSIREILKNELVREFGRPDVPIGMLIEFLKKLENQAGRKGIFPFKVIRAVDNSAKAREIMKFTDQKNNYLNLDPRVIICLLEKKRVFLTDFRIVFPEKYVL